MHILNEIRFTHCYDSISRTNINESFTFTFIYKFHYTKLVQNYAKHSKSDRMHRAVHLLFMRMRMRMGESELELEAKTSTNSNIAKCNNLFKIEYHIL